MKAISLLLSLSVAATPLYFLRLNFGPLPIYLPEIFTLTALVGYLFLLATGKTKIVWPPLTIIVPVVVFLLGAVWATFGSDSDSWGPLKSWVLLPSLFGFLTHQTLAQDEKASSHLETALFTAGVTVSLWGLIEMIVSGGRLNSFFNSPNSAAMWLVPSFFILLTTWRRGRIFQAGLLVVFLAIILTKSFGGYLALGFGSIVAFLVQRWWPKGQSSILAGFGGTLIAFAYASVTTYLPNLVGPLFGQRLGGRLQIWAMGRDGIRTFGYQGLGPGQFEKFYLSKVGMTFPNPIEWNVPQPHNLYLATWLGSGLLGLVGLLTLVLGVVTRLLKTGQVFLLGAVTAILVHGLVDTTYWKNDLAIIFFLVVALSLNPQSLNQPTS